MSVRTAWTSLAESPVLDREKLTRARSWRTPVTMAAFVSALGGFALVMFSLAISGAPDNRPSAVDMAQVAFLTAGLQLVLALLLVPPLAATAISGERERGTLDVLVLGQLTPGSIAVTKLAASLAYLVLVMAMAVPVLVSVFLYAGLGLVELLLVELVTLATVATLAAVALLVGSWFSRTLAATLAAYVVGVVLYAGTALVGVVVHFDAPLNLERGLSSSVHPVVFANPFYAVHAVVLGPSPAGAHVGHLGELVVLSPGASTWGPVVQPWQLSVAAQLVLAGVCLAAARRAVGRRRHRREGTAFPTFARWRHRLGTRSAVGMVLLAAAAAGTTTLMAVAAGAQPAERPAAGGGVTVTAGPRWGRSTPGSWTAYEVRVRNDGGRDIEGEVVLVAEPSPPTDDEGPRFQSGGPPAQPKVVALGEREMTVAAVAAKERPPSDFPIHRAPMALAGNGAEKATTMVVVEAPYGHRAELRDRSGATIAVSRRPAGSQPQYTVALMSTVSGAQDALARLRDFMPGDPLAVTTIASVRDAPRTALGFSGLDAVVIDDFDTAALAPPQVRALRDYVALGGSLVLGGGAAGARAAKALPDELVPLDPSATALASMAALAGLVERPTTAAAPVVTGALRRGRVILEGDGGVPLVVQAEHRGGRVVQLGYDPLQEPFASDPALQDLAFQQGIGRALYGLVRAARGGDTGVAPFEQLWSALPSGGGWAPWPRPGTWALAAYGVGVIPLGYGLLRARGRVNLLWLAAPGAALVFAVLAGALGESRTGASQPALEVMTVGPAGTAMISSYQGVQALGRGTRHVEAATGAVSSLFTAPNLTTASPPGLQGSGGGQVRHEGGAELALPTTPGQVARYQVLSIGDGAGLESRLRLVGSAPPEEGGLRVAGTVTNHSEGPVRRLRVQLPEGAQAHVADVIAPGQTLPVDAVFVWPTRLDPGAGVRSAPEDLVVFAAADRAFTRAGQAVVVGLGEGPGTQVMVEVVPLEATENPVAGTGGSHQVAGVPGVENKVVFELDGLGGLGPMNLLYGTHAAPPDVYDWTARTWRPLPPGNQSVGLTDSAPLMATEVRDGLVRVRATVSQTTTGFQLAVPRP